MFRVCLYSARMIIITLVFVIVCTCGMAQTKGSSSSAVEVTLSREKPLWLDITLHSSSDHSATILKSQLPWGYRYSMVFVAARTTGEPLEMDLPVDDPVAETVLVPSRASLTGHIDLRTVISDLNTVTKQGDILLFWAYKAPADLQIDGWSGGCILVPRASER